MFCHELVGICRIVLSPAHYRVPKIDAGFWIFCKNIVTQLGGKVPLTLGSCFVFGYGT